MRMAPAFFKRIVPIVSDFAASAVCFHVPVSVASGIISNFSGYGSADWLFAGYFAGFTLLHYCGFMDWQAIVRPRKFRIRVADGNHQAISACRAILWTALKFLPWELSHFMAYRMIYLGDGNALLMDYVIGGLVYTMILLYILMTIFTKNKQSLYDRLAKIYVVKSSFS